MANEKTLQGVRLPIGYIAKAEEEPKAVKETLGSTSSSVSDHWALRLSVTRRESLALRSTVNCINHLPSPEIPTLLEKVPDKGANGSKSFVRGVKGRSASMKLPSASKLKLSISKAMPLRWSFGSKDRKKRETGELVEYLESGRRPKFTSESIVPLMTGVPNGNKDTKSNLKNQVVHVAATGSGAQPKISTVVDTHRGKGKEKAMSHERTYNGLAEAKYKDTRPSGESYSSDTNSVLKGEKGDAMMRNIIKVRNMRAKPSEAEGQVNSTKQKPGLVQKEPRRQSGAENFVELPNGKPRISLSNGIPSGMDGRTSGTMPRQHKEDMTKTKLPADLRRAHSSSSVINKADWHQKRAESLYKNGNVSQQSSGQVTNEKQSASSLQRMRYHTSSLGRKKSVPESSF
ncbi:hypothetical protein GDO86_000145 [Hymenochirus boettgeri]|uniref:Uncharacterized protein n=1 Tax=Hymenochirus boettgeri TaxID=247094 RepID=A0A8T2KBZ2_9PIPI|nr:hypothetical protein GDO86_000145 [Hymenochirus boettgeri]